MFGIKGRNRLPLLASFIGCNFVALGAGAIFIYSYYTPKLLSRCNIPLSEASNISFALNLGTSLLGLLAGIIIDNAGPAVACLLGAVMLFLSYLTLLLCYNHQVSSVPLVSLAFMILGFGSILGHFSALRVCTTNFPENRGTVSAFPISLYGLSGMVFSVLCSSLFNDKIEQVFVFLMVVCPAMVFVGFCTMKIVGQDSSGSSPGVQQDLVRTPVSSVGTSNNNMERDTYELKDMHGQRLFKPDEALSLSKMRSPPRPSDDPMSRNITAPYFYFPLKSRGDSTPIEEKPSFFLEQDKQMELLEPISVASSTRSLYLAESGLTMNFNFLKTSMSKVTNSRVFRAFLKPEYLSYYAILALIQGVDKMYIYSVGFIVQIQLNTPEMQRYDIQPEVFQAVQTSVFAMFSFLGRISSGPLSDILVRRFRLQRMWIVLLSGVLVAVASKNITRNYPTPNAGVVSDFKSIGEFPNLKNVSFCSALFGYSFGAIFVVLPTIVADSFGTDGFSTLWSIFTTSALPSLKIFTKVFSDDLMEHANMTGGSVCSLGAECYAHTFHVTFYCTLFALVLAILLISAPHWRKWMQDV